MGYDERRCGQRTWWDPQLARVWLALVLLLPGEPAWSQPTRAETGVAAAPTAPVAPAAPAAAPAAPSRSTVQPNLPAVIDPPAIARPLRVVPDVVGREVNEARRTLKQQGFRSVVAPGQPNEGRVVRTDPSAGSRHKTPPVVTLDVQADVPAPRRMPSIVGLDCDAARARLEAAKLRLARCEPGVATGSVAVGRINSQSPAADSALIVTSMPVVVARVEPVAVPRVPNVVGRPAAEAMRTLEGAGFRGQPSIAPVQAWHVVDAQAPAAGASAERSAAVRLTLGSRHVVPSLLGASCDEARRRVEGAGLSLSSCAVDDVAPAQALAAGRIHRQQPPPQTEWRQPVAVLAWTPRATVPSLVGAGEEQAMERVRAAGLTIRVTGPAAARGRVVAGQTPAANARVEPGSNVDARMALTVPALVGRTCAEAQSLAREHGFTAFECTDRRATVGQALQRVFEQTPTAQTKADTSVPLRAVVARGVVVPDVRRITLTAALARLRDAGLDGQPDAGTGDRDVVSTTPQAGAEVAPQTAVRLATQGMVQVPAVEGLTLDAARSRMTAVGLRPAADDATQPDLRRITKQTPSAQTRVATGSGVALVTTLDAVVPDVVGRNLEDAVSFVSAAGLEPVVKASARPEAKVVRAQTPLRDQRVPRGSIVNLEARARVAVPTLVDGDCEQAQAKARLAGVAVGACRVDSSLLRLLGAPIVFAQSEAAGQIVDEGSPVQLDARPPMLPTVVGGTSVLAAVAGLLAWLRAPRSTTTNGSASGGAPTKVRIRLDPDPSPRVTIVAPADHEGSGDEGSEGSEGSEGVVGVRWRIDAGEPQVLIEAWSDGSTDEALATEDER